jgi:long-chain acyl-CoA synthetase
MLFEPLFTHAADRPDDLAAIDDSGQYTHKQLATLAAGLGIYLKRQTERDKVGLLLPSGVAFVAGFFGTLLAGKTVVPINFLLGEKEMAHIIADSGIDTVLTIPQLAPRLASTGLKVIDVTTLPRPNAITGAIALHAPKPRPAPDDLAVIMYTSGTSALPKGVMLTYNNLQSDVESAIQHAKLTGKHHFLGILPLFHSTGMLATLLAPVVLGARTVYIARFSPVATLNAIRQHQISIVAAVPSMYGAIVRLKDAKAEDFANMYAAISGGEPLPANIREAFTQKFNMPIYEGYGLTETIGPIAFNVPGAIKPGSVGRIIPHAQVKLIDDEGNTLPQGQDGEICLKGPMVMRGYYNLPAETAAAFTADGYFKSGDLGHLDDEGYLFVTGRKKDLIIVAGEKAVPREIEEILIRHPAVAEAAVVGKKDPNRGEVVVAYVIAKEGQTVKGDELREFGRSQGLAQWKLPREVTVVDELPRTSTGKVLKRVLAERANGGESR